MHDARTYDRRTTMARSLVSPDDQRVTFVELFFDLIFVFCVTQVVTLLHAGVDVRAVGSAVLAFWMVWWAWTQFTWALNAANTDHPQVQLTTLLATAVAFFLAIGIPRAFDGGGLGFAVPYVTVRVLGLIAYHQAAAQDATQRRAVRIFGACSALGMAAVLAGGLSGGSSVYWFWSAAIALDLVAAGIGGQLEGWNLHPDHFAERHGLIVIIALGETLIVAAAGLTGTDVTSLAVVTGILAVTVTCGLWWSYFRHARPVLERALSALDGGRRSRLARDAFSVLHFPMLCGIIAMAAAVEEALAHPDAALPVGGRGLLGIGAMLFVGGTGVALWRATGRAPVWRFLLPAGVAAALLGFEATPWRALAVLLAVLVALSLIEARAKPLQ